MDTELQHKTLRVNGQRVHLVEIGAGPMVLRCTASPNAGIPGSISFGSSRMRVTGSSLLIRGYGRSSKPSAVHDYRITELVAIWRQSCTSSARRPQ
jgi:hypothetical protein